MIVILWKCEQSYQLQKTIKVCMLTLCHNAVIAVVSERFHCRLNGHGGEARGQGLLAASGEVRGLDACSCLFLSVTLTC